eukprot:212980-Prorocentrum_minimum.AAC.8
MMPSDGGTSTETAPRCALRPAFTRLSVSRPGSRAGAGGDLATLHEGARGGGPRDNRERAPRGERAAAARAQRARAQADRGAPRARAGAGGGHPPFGGGPRGQGAGRVRAHRRQGARAPRHDHRKRGGDAGGGAAARSGGRGDGGSRRSGRGGAGSHQGSNSTSFYGSSCANNGKGALNTPEHLRGGGEEMNTKRRERTNRKAATWNLTPTCFVPSIYSLPSRDWSPLQAVLATAQAAEAAAEARALHAVEGERAAKELVEELTETQTRAERRMQQLQTALKEHQERPSLGLGCAVVVKCAGLELSGDALSTIAGAVAYGAWGYGVTGVWGRTGMLRGTLEYSQKSFVFKVEPWKFED